jgi:hypothetical protein
MPIHIPNVATEVAKDSGLLYASLDTSTSQLYLGFTAKPTTTGITFINPYWGKTQPNVSELLPVSQKDVSVVLSKDASQLGARATVEFTGLSPRIKFSLVASPPTPVDLGAATIAFKGVWPLRGAYHVSGLAEQYLLLRKELEPFGSVILRTTAIRALGIVADNSTEKGWYRFDASDSFSLGYIMDNLLSDLLGMFFDDVSKQMVVLKSNPTLSDNTSNTYESSQESVFIRVVRLSLGT